MNVLFVATRSPWPSIDGGRVLMARTIDGLLARGHRVTVVAPQPDPGPPSAIPPAPPGLQVRLVPVRRRGWIASAVRSRLSGRPTAVERQVHAAVAREAARCAAAGVDVVHVQQLHALANAERLTGGAAPVVLRAENVEADLWRQAGATTWWRPATLGAGRRLRRWETAALGRVDATAPVSERDAASLRRLAPRAYIDVVAIPMPASLPAGRPLAGDPAIVLLASGWRPNRAGARWFLRACWPGVAAALPAARLHVFGPLPGAGRAAGVVAHAAPADSTDAFPDGAIVVVPPRAASGANVRILEAWARGVPVVATPAAAAGVDPGGAAVATASTAAEFTAAFRRLQAPEARRRAIAAGRDVLAQQHDPHATAVALERVYAAAIHAAADRAGGRGRS